MHMPVEAMGIWRRCQPVKASCEAYDRFRSVEILVYRDKVALSAFDEEVAIYYSFGHGKYEEYGCHCWVENLLRFCLCP